VIGRLSEKVEKMKKNESTGAQNEQTESTGTVHEWKNVFFSKGVTKYENIVDVVKTYWAVNIWNSALL
jgi:ubiquitin-protein ligase